MRAARGIARVTRRAVLGLLLAAAGCASPPPPAPPGGPDMGGISLQLRLTDEAGKAVVYHVDPDGMLHFGGGMDAAVDRTTWSGPLTEAEAAELRRRLEGGHWFDRELPATGEPAERRWWIEVRGPAGRRRHKLRGECPEAEAVEALLENAARRRLDRFMERMPEPGQPE